jgi:hypothetical protein
MADMADSPQAQEPIPPTREELEEQARRSIFATHIAYGSAIPDALRGAGYSSQSLNLGWTLLSYREVRDQIDQHRTYIRDKQARSINELIEQLDRDREFAIETRQAAVAVAATMAQAKLLGHLDPTATLKLNQKRLVITWGGDEVLPPPEDRTIDMEPLPERGIGAIADA